MRTDEDKIRVRHRQIRRIASFVVMSCLLLGMFFLAVNTGSLKVSLRELVRGLFVEYNETVSTIFDLRFPRIIIAMLSGAGVAVSGALFQAVLKNPLADPGIIGISSGASFVTVLCIAVLPQLYFFTPLFAFLGGVFAFFLVYSLSWKGGLSPLRIILVGVAINAMFTGLTETFNALSGGNIERMVAVASGNISMKTWDDVRTLFPYTLAGLILACVFSGKCDLLSLEDRTARSLGVNVNQTRLLLSLIAVCLASISTAVAGAISFLGLIVPHIGRILVGSEHRVLIPFSMLFGAFAFLVADTIGRTIAAPAEISPAICMSVVGGPFFVFLLRRTKKYQ
ncbi:MAG: iron ABC transporter permease [Eubacterium sp.]|nr:iron ABC transporter permease [Eubacterium sp.]